MNFLSNFATVVLLAPEEIAKTAVDMLYVFTAVKVVADVACIIAETTPSKTETPTTPELINEFVEFVRYKEGMDHNLITATLNLDQKLYEDLTLGRYNISGDC